MGRKIYHVIYADANGGPKAKAAPTIDTAKRRVIPIPLFAEGFLHRVFVTQNGGTDVAFDVRMFASKIPYGDGSGAQADYNGAVTGIPEHFEVFPKLAQITAGNDHDWRASDELTAGECPFMNMDGSSQSVAERFLYLVIIPDNSVDESTWEITVIAEPSLSD